MTRVAVIGAGIKGSTVAALLSLSDTVTVVVYEASEAGTSGATLTNHGRLHLGTAGFSTDSTDLMRRRHRGSRLWRALGIGEGTPPAVYAFDDVATLEKFRSVCGAAGIPVRPAQSLPVDWIDDPMAAFDVLEYGFDPAVEARRMRAVAEARGVEWRTGTVVTEVGAGRDLEVTTAAGVDSFDVVVNCAARWSSQIALTWRDDPLVEVDWFIWQIMVARAADLPPLSQVVVQTRSSGHHASVVPHGEYVTLDFKFDAAVEPVSSPPDRAPRLRPVMRRDPYLETCVNAFPALADAKEVFSFDGIQGRVRGAKPGSVSTIHDDVSAPGYIVSQGGQASTVILDSLEVVERLWSDRYLDDDPLVILGRLLRSYPEKLPSPGPRMAWEATGGAD